MGISNETEVAMNDIDEGDAVLKSEDWIWHFNPV